MPCVFCEIVGGRAAAQIIDQDDLAFCVLDINPLAEGHCLVLPKRHVPWWQDMSDDEVSAVFRMAKRIANRLRDVYASEFVCMYARGRRIPHTHIFLVPTTKGDVLDRHFNELEKVQEASDALAPLRIKESLARSAKKIRG